MVDGSLVRSRSLPIICHMANSKSQLFICQLINSLYVSTWLQQWSITEAGAARPAKTVIPPSCRESQSQLNTAGWTQVVFRLKVAIALIISEKLGLHDDKHCSLLSETTQL